MDGMSYPEISEGEIYHLIHHIFLPPKLPHSGDDPQAVAYETSLLTTTFDALRSFGSHVEPEFEYVVDEAYSAIRRLRDLRDTLGFMDEDRLRQAFYNLAQDGDPLIIHVKAQNAGILMNRNPKSVTFEFFELSPLNKAAMSTQGRLRRHFPASGVSIPIQTFRDDAFLSTLSETIAKMSHQEVAEMKPKVKKAGDEHIEDRETTDPSIVTDFLATSLSALGKSLQIHPIKKNTREEVLWKDAKLPWRRSPLWLLVRVALQIFFSRHTLSRNPYKEFMVFLMRHILEVAKPLELPSDILFCMAAKISRRLLKLDRSFPYPWLSSVEQTLSSVRCSLEKRWRSIMQQTDSDLQVPLLHAPEVEQDTRASCPELDDFIKRIESRKCISSEVAFHPSWFAAKFDTSNLPSLQRDPSDESSYFGLLAFENWVEISLDSWLRSHISEKDTCRELLGAMRSYHQISSSHYSDNPESLSLMLLTVLELWVACDKSASRHHTLLLDYDPEIPCELLESLILPFKGQMKRLSDVEAYVKDRRGRAKQSNPCIFSSFGHAQSFSVRYFSSSVDHQDLLRRIEDDASRERERKREEFHALKEDYNFHMEQYKKLPCIKYRVVDSATGVPREVHCSSCRRCLHLHLAEALSIEVHEWPLPTDKLKAQSTVFELQPPAPFNTWRDMSTYVLVDVLKSAYNIFEGGKVELTLEQYLPYFHATAGRRLSLASTTKSNRKTHRRGKAIGTAVERDVLVQNGLTYQYFDNEARCWVSKAEVTDKIPLMCTYKLSEQCASLQMFLFRPFHSPNGLSPNHVISQQAYCPNHLSLEEFKAMTTLAIGYRLQWSNILVQLHMPAVDFKKVDTLYILLQTSRQAGPPSHTSVCRAGHQQLCDEVFAQKCLEGLTSSLERIKENWESHHALGGLISLAARLLSLAPTLGVSSLCLSFLERCRKVALNWVDRLQNRIQHSDDDDHRTECLKGAFRAAYICASSFDVDENHLCELLTDPSKAAILIESFMVVQNTLHSASQLQDLIYRTSIQALRRLQYKSCDILLEEIVHRNSSCLDLAIRKSWSAYPGGGAWRPVSTTDYCWLTTRTAARNGSGCLVVHFSLLTGELLVGGLPLSRLPANYEKHHVYRTLFGKITLEVLPTKTPGMQFSSKKAHHEYTLSFGMSNCSKNDFLLGATKDGRTLDLVPPRVFKNMLPHELIHDYVHWYDRETQAIEFRMKKTPWTSSRMQWRMRKTATYWVLERDGRLLVSIMSDSAKGLSHLLVPLENEHFIHVILNTASSKIEVEMPRLQLEFFLQLGSKKLVSRQFRGMFVDSDQRIGTLVGLESKLVLRNDSNCRKVLLPDGQVSWRRSPEHVQVSVLHGTSSRIHAYEIDWLLGRLVDNGNLQSKLTLCYLHALTSYCLPDEHTGKTGTEESLSILNSAAVRSFDCLSQDILDKLDMIANLSPKRTYYPIYLSDMENTSWDSDLSFLSQHGGFFSSVESIFAQASATQFFHPDSYIEPPELAHVDSLLGRRHSIRASAFQICRFGAENHSSAYDVSYEGRDTVSFSDKSTRVFEISSMVFQSQQTLHRNISPTFVDEMWTRLSNNDIEGPGKPLPVEEISYDARWLGDQNVVLPEYWCRLHRTLASSPPNLNKYQKMLCLAAMAYSETSHSDVVQSLVAISSIPAVRQIEVPNASQFRIVEGRKVDRTRLLMVTRQSLTDFSSCPEHNLPRLRGEGAWALQTRRESKFRVNQSAATERFVNSIQNQWVSQQPYCLNDSTLITYIKLSNVMTDVRPMWTSWYQNHLFYEYLGDMANALRQCPIAAIHRYENQAESQEKDFEAPKNRPFLSEEHLFRQSIPSLLKIQVPHLDLCLAATIETEKGNKLEDLIERLKGRASRQHEYESNYIRDLERSLLSLRNQNTAYSVSQEGENLREKLCENFSQCLANANTIYDSLKTWISLDTKAERPVDAPATSHSERVAAIFMSPRVCPSFFLRQLARAQWKLLPQAWKKAVAAYGIALTKLQRAARMLGAYGNESDLLKELLNQGHTNWDPLSHPETLLLEVESGILIRAVQEEIAALMREPPNHANAVMQLNMGEGKSSVIVPIVAAHLADGSKLVCVVVAKPQAKELFRTLLSKLGGLLNHRIYQMPFSRSLRLTKADVRSIDKLYRECMEVGGLLLVQPESMLSLKLMAVECQSSGRQEIGSMLLDIQHFFNLHSQVVIDESDENLSPKFELVYTMGTQKAIELSPERWTIAQRVLGIVALTASDVQEQLPASIEVTHCKESHFPRTRILRPDAQALLLTKVAKIVCDTGIPGLPIARQSDALRKSVFIYISEAHLSPDQIASVEGNSTFFNDATKGLLLMLRGLVAGGVLGFTLTQKRWRVNYGLDPSRKPSTKLAVPYRAKDSPTPRSEFSHPDVVILLTCLSYYYDGLSDEALTLAFQHLIMSDQADIEYHEWVMNAPSLPPPFHRLMGVNMKDLAETTRSVFPHLRFGKSVIDYYLSHIVFPKEMKEFPLKLSASGWDVGQKRTLPTTGFSGTNDSRHLLPLDVKHLDLEKQRHTNALVLDNLLRAENKVELLPRPLHGNFSAADTLLSLVTSMKDPIQVILDVGAQMLELTNIEVAKQWLKMLPKEQEKEAAVFFNDDELFVIDQQGNVERLQTSHYADKLDDCVLFLDQIHTRGTDLNLPRYYRAAVILGPNLTKDGLVQACMRMRKLAMGQSVVFCIPDEIKSRIYATTGIPHGRCIQVSDVLTWVISETYNDLHRNMPLWAVQGARFERQKMLWAEATTSAGVKMFQEQAERFLEVEAQTLESRYRPTSHNSADCRSPFSSNSTESTNIASILKRCEEFGILNFRTAALHEQQERELAPEIERERQVERPQPAEPEEHALHPHVINFVATGNIPLKSPAFEESFLTLWNTSAAECLDMDQFPSGVLATADYTRTVKLPESNPCMDSYQRPIQWILTSTDESQAVRHLVIISPYEAQELMVHIMKSRCVVLHLYAPQSNLSFPELDALKLYNVPILGPDWKLPSHLRLQLNLFAGQLYFTSFDDYKQTCEILSLAWELPKEGSIVAADGFVVKGIKHPESKFTSSPVKCLKVLLATIRRDCQDIGRTHWGRVLAGEIMKETDYIRTGDKGGCGISLPVRPRK